VGIHVPTVDGTQGIGVRTPRAAAVADDTVGFAIDEHIPQDGMFTNGEMSCIVAAGFPPIISFVWEVTLSDAGTVPKEHCTMAPVTTIFPTNFLLSP